MVLNDFKKEIKIKLIENGETQRSIAEKIGTPGQYITKVLNEVNIVNNTFIKILDALGYDIKIEYIRK